jgi:multiple sugar transport system permease protein
VLINMVLQTVLALGLALLMHRVAKSTIIRGALLLPYLMANVIAALLWFWLLDYQIGIVNHFIEALGLPRVAFFGSEAWAIPTQALINTWRHVGYTALLLFAGLQAIPRQIYEVADLDGASPFQTLWRITLPLLRPVIALVVIVTAIGSIQIFDTVAVTTQGGPVNASRVLQFYIYQRAFTESDFGYGSALAVILFVILAVVAFVQMKFLRGNESDLD